MEIDRAENLTKKSLNKIELHATFEESLFSNYYRIVGDVFKSMQVDLKYTIYKPIGKGYSCEDGCYSVIGGNIKKEYPELKRGNERVKTFKVNGNELIFRFNPKSTVWYAIEIGLKAVATGSFLAILLNLFKENDGRNKR
jgi:hypothetical protein